MEVRLLNGLPYVGHLWRLVVLVAKGDGRSSNLRRFVDVFPDAGHVHSNMMFRQRDTETWGRVIVIKLTVGSNEAPYRNDVLGYIETEVKHVHECMSAEHELMPTLTSRRASSEEEVHEGYSSVVLSCIYAQITAEVRKYQSQDP